MSDNLVTFPQGFLWGAATAAHQVEGNNRNNDWWQWEKQPGKIADGTRSGKACDWWGGRAEEDLRRAAAMGHTAHRMSLEWSRLEPTQGKWDDAAFERYRTIIKAAADLGLTPLVTIYHFTLPQWAAEKGGWLNKDMYGFFGRFAAECILRLGDLVTWWATMNEPMVLTYMAYIGKRWTPGLGSIAAGRTAIANLLRAHHSAYVLGKAIQPNAQIGIVHNAPIFDPASNGRLDRTIAAAQDYIINRVVLDSLDAGEIVAPIAVNNAKLVGGPRAFDWMGLNYYGQNVVKFDVRHAGELFGRFVQDSVRSEAGTDWGAIYPEGLTRGLRRLAKFGKPLFVTENGLYDNTDTRRPTYMLRHIKATHDAIAEGIDVRGYTFWSLVDNFEWAEGWGTHFGLLALNRETQERTPRHSASVYEQVVRANGIPRALWETEVSSDQLAVTTNCKTQNAKVGTQRRTAAKTREDV